MLGEITKVVSFKMMDYAHQYSCISGLCLMDFWGEKIHIKIFNLSFFFLFFKNYKVARQIACWYLKTRGNSATVFGIVYKKRFPVKMCACSFAAGPDSSVACVCK